MPKRTKFVLPWLHHVYTTLKLSTKWKLSNPKRPSELKPLSLNEYIETVILYNALIIASVKLHKQRKINHENSTSSLR